MSLRKAGLAIQFAGGVSTKQDAKQVPTTQLIDLQNATFVRDTTLRKRNGYRALGQQIDDAAMTYAQARGLAERDGELVLFTERTSMSYRPSSDSWSDIGDVASVTATTRPLARSGTQQVGPDAAALDGVQLLGWEDSRGGVWCTVIEEDTGRILLAETQLDSNAEAKDVRCCRCGGVMILLWRRADQNAIWIITVNPASPLTVPTPTVLTSDLDTTNPVYDAEYSLEENTAVIAWAVGGGYRVGRIDGSGVLGSPVTGWPSVATISATFDGPLAVTGPLGGFWAVGYCATVLTIDFLDNGETVSRTATTTVPSVRVTNGASRLTLAWGAYDTVLGANGVWYALELQPVTRWDQKRVLSARILSGSSSLDSATPGTLKGHALASRAFRDNLSISDATQGDVYVAVVHPVQFHPYVAIVRLSSSDGFGGTARTVAMARLLPRETTGYLARGTPSDDYEPIEMLPSVYDVGFETDGSTVTYTREHAFASGYRIQLSSENSDQFAEAGIKLVALDFDADGSYQTAELGRGLYLAGACPQHYDGSRWGEADPHTAPDIGYDTDGESADMATEMFSSATGGAMTSGDTYVYRLWYEFVDAQGELHVGPVSTVEFALADVEAATAVGIDIPTYRLTQRDNVRICVARTVANATGTIDTMAFYRVTSTDPRILTGANCFVFNDPTADFVSFVDKLSDADLQLREPLYTNGGILSNDPAPWAGDVIAGGKNRLYWTDPTDPDLVRYSQEQREETAVEAPGALSIPVDSYGGRIVGIGAMDDTVIVFKETAIYFFAGPGPLADGGFASQDAFSPAQLLTSDVGCSSASSIAQTPAGIVFQSNKGIYLLGRDRAVRSIGDPVYAYKDQRISRATLLPDRHQVLFLTDDADGRSLLWDYERNQWSTYTNHVGYDASIIANTYYYLRTDGRVFVETPGVYVDDNSHISMVIETAWIKMAGYLQGWQRVHHAMFVGRYVSSHTLRVKYRIDYQEGYSAPFDIDVDADYLPDNYGDGGYGDGPYGGDLDAGAVYQQRIHINQRCQAISFQIRDVEDTDEYGAAFELSELLLTGGQLGPAFQPGSSRSQ